MDLRLFQALNSLATHGRVLDDIVRFAAVDLVIVFPAFLVALWLFPGRDPHRVRTAAVTGAAAALLALGLNQVLNHLVDRARPYAAHPAHLLLARTGDASFPSDHTAVAFAVATTLWVVRPRLSTVLAVLGGLVGLARVIAGAHYPGDVLGGAAVGALAALTLWWLAQRPIGVVTRWGELAYDAVLRPVRRARAAADTTN